MTDSRTPICDLIERLLMSRDLSHGTLGQALEAARPVEAALSRGSRTTEERREIERKRKADYRSRKAAESRGTNTPHISTPKTQNLLVKERKKETTVPLSHGTLLPADDWPENYLDLFWSKYPPGRKTGKKAVAAKLAAIRKRQEITFARLMLGVTRYAESRPEPKFTKAPEVWLNKGCWDDEITLFASSKGNAFAALRQRLADNQQEGETRT